MVADNAAAWAAMPPPTAAQEDVLRQLMVGFENSVKSEISRTLFKSVDGQKVKFRMSLSLI